MDLVRFDKRYCSETVLIPSTKDGCISSILEPDDFHITGQEEAQSVAILAPESTKKAVN
jgi:hypothetical protein